MQERDRVEREESDSVSESELVESNGIGTHVKYVPQQVRRERCIQLNLLYMQYCVVCLLSVCECVVRVCVCVCVCVMCE